MKVRKGRSRNKVKIVLDKTTLLSELQPEVAYYCGVLTFYLFEIGYDEKRKTLLPIVQKYLINWQHEELTEPIRQFDRVLAL